MAAKHPASFLPEDERMDYLVAVASLVTIDGHADDAEIERLGTLCDALSVESAERRTVLASARKPDAKIVERSLKALAGRPAMSLSLLTDAIAIAFADEKLTDEESAEIARMAEKLRVSQADANLVAKYVESLVMHHGEAHLDHMAKELREALLARDPDSIRKLAGKA
jgi:uncharacterized tellurite resistance protein B-like protein